MIHNKLPEESEIEITEKKLLAKAKKLLEDGTPNWYQQKFHRLLDNPNNAKIHILFYLRSKNGSQRPIRVYEISQICQIGKTNIYKYLNAFVKLGVIIIQQFPTVTRYKPIKHVTIRRPDILDEYIKYALDILHTTLEEQKREQIMMDGSQNRLLSEMAEDTIYVWEQEDGWNPGKMKRCEGTRELFTERVKGARDMGKKIRLIGKKEDMLEFE